MEQYLIFAACVTAVLGAAEYTVRRLTELCAYSGLSDSFVGLTILSIGTSFPEILTHIAGSLRILLEPHRTADLSAIVIGSNVGSDIVQQNLMLPIVAMVGGLRLPRPQLVPIPGALVGATALLLAFCIDGRLTRPEGAIMVLLYIGYLAWLRRGAADATLFVPPTDRRRAPGRGVWIWFAILLGFLVMAGAAGIGLSAATRIVERWPNLSGSLFGVAILGVATALPELSTAVVGLLRGKQDISVGVLVGSNITNPLFSAGLGAVISGYRIPTVVTNYDLPVKLVSSAAIFVFFWRSGRLTRSAGALLLATYAIYLVSRHVLFPEDLQPR